MAEKNFMTAGTEVEAYVAKIDQCLNKISNILGEACISRVNSGKVSNTLENDISGIISSLPVEQQVIVLKKLAVLLCTQMKGNSSTESRKANRAFADDIFARRR